VRSAIVVGAGVGGLATAGALARTGWQVTLLERAERLRADGAGLLLWPNGVRALRALDLAGGLDAIATEVPYGGIRRPDGQWLVRPDPAVGRVTPLVVHSEDLHDQLIAGLGDHIDIRNGITVRTVRATADDRPAVGDGRNTWEADLVVAADGVNSAVRARVARQVSVVSAGCAAWRAVIPWYRAPALPAGRPRPTGPMAVLDDPAKPGMGGETLGSGYRFQWAALGERGSAGGSSRGGIYWVATALGAPRPEAPATQLTLLRRWFSDWHAPIGDLLAATEPDDLVQHAVQELRPAPRGYGFPAGPGGVALLGDAAHALPDHLGQGTGLAFEDAATLRSVLLDAVPGGSLRDALGAYTRARLPRVARLARQSRRVGTVLQARGRFTQRARDAAFGALSPRLLDRTAADAASWRP
jgi:2-polyprenyl-6-methoxyphenol hydroxylase-like FAD-dependent oxidoreductase